MSNYGFWYNYLWIAPHVLLAGLCILLLQRKLAREYPAFFAYTVYECFQFILGLALYRYKGITDDQYMEIYLIGACISSLLRFAIVYEVFRHLFHDYPVLSTFGKILYRWSAALLVLASVILIAWTTQDLQNHVSIWVNVVDRMVCIIQLGLLVVLFGASRFLGFSWRNLSFGIALGLGLFAAVELAVTAVRAAYGPATMIMFFNYFTMGTYHVCVMIWLFYAWAPERYMTFSPLAVRENTLEGWNLALKRVIER